MEPSRPDPDALLASVAAEQARQSGGKLKIFLGAAPGVGKTYAMLGAARELTRQGVDVVVGIAETHGRPETEALLEGLEVLPRQRLEYRGKVLTELDLDTLLRRRPRVALVDELAHRNAPGARHERRYQDIAELLDAGIDVYTTVNVQHFESLNDVIEQITGVRVRETVPDGFFDRVTDMVLIDLPPRELIERLREGKVYVPEQAKAALEAFFSPSNLTALRELAMHTAAERVETDLVEYLDTHGLAAGESIRRRVLVAVDGHPHTEYLVRLGRRTAERRHAPWTVAYVDTGSRRSRTDSESLHAAFQLAQRLGADTVVLRGSSVAEELRRYAERHRVATILVGQTRERLIPRLLGRTVTQRLLQADARFELTIVSTPYTRARARRTRVRARPWPRRLAEYGLATAATVAAILTSAVFASLLPVGSLALIFIVAVLVVAVQSRLAAAVYTAVACFVAYNFFFTEPRFTLIISSVHDLVAVFAFLVAALVCGQLAARLRSRVVMLRAANEHTGALQALGERLAAAADEAQVFQAGSQSLASALGCEAMVLRRQGSEAKALRRVAALPPTAHLETADRAAADWVVEHAQTAGRYTGTFAGSPWWFVPLVVERGCLGTVGLRFPPAQTLLTPEQRRLAEAMVHQVALAAERTELAVEVEAARVESETERLRSALLSSVSHDLRSPLASVIGAATSLSAYGETMAAPDRRELLAAIRSEAERLDRYIQNLLDMTRLGSGGMKLRRDWIGIDDVLGSALGRLRKLYPALAVATELPPDLPLLYVHPALIEQALFNILENAAKFSPPGAPVATAVRRADDRLIVDITDRGPGIPEEERRQIFDMFHSAARGDRGRRGSGLGLTIVRGMIGAHGGRVEALPGEGGVGTTIRVTLPIPEPPPPEAAEDDA